MSSTRTRLPLPDGETETSLLAYLAGFRNPAWDDRGAAEFRNYLSSDFRRFVFTLGLVPSGSGRLLEIGADPYFTTLLLRRFRRYELSLTNGEAPAPGENQAELVGADGARMSFRYSAFNMETDEVPYPGEFDVVLCCEVVEHMTQDPLRALLTIHRSLRPGGTLVLTTPNAARAGVVFTAAAGLPVHDAYSAYGPYGRHNREYTPSEMKSLLEHAGFRVEEEFVADVHPRPAGWKRLAMAAARAALVCARRAWSLVSGRPAEGIGAYSFFRAVKVSEPARGRPRWLYRSYPEHELSSG
jgi:SAM-dependent methyltransferase